MSMSEYEKLADLIGDIHDTAIDPALWTGVLGRIMDFVGGQACALISKDSASKLGNVHYQVGIDPHYTQAYAETYAPFDPLANLPAVSQVVSIPDLVTYDEYRRGPFFQDFLRPQGWTDAAHVVLEKSAANRAAVLVIVPSKTRGMVEDEMRRRMALITPHARRALLIAKARALKQSEATTLADESNCLNAGMFLIDAGGRIVHSNAAGHEMLYSGDFLRSEHGQLVARNELTNQILRDASAACANGDVTIGAKGTALPLTAHNGERYVAHVLPLTAGLRRSTGLAYMAVAAVFVRKADLVTS